MNKRKKVIAVNAFLIAALFGLVTLNKEVLRPAVTGDGLLPIITGCFPNFIAAFLISLAIVSAAVIRKFKRGRLLVYAASLAVFIILSIEEIKPMWGASTAYDPYDIVASGVGAVLAVICFEFLVRFTKNRQEG